MSRYYYSVNGTVQKFSNVEKFEDVNNFEYKGCWKDTTDRAIPTFLEGVKPENCMSEAVKRGFNTYGLQNGNQCFVGNDPNYTKYGSAEKCDKNGNVWTNQVYQKFSDTNVNGINVANTLCFTGKGVKQCINAGTLENLYKDVDTLKKTVPNNNVINMNRMDAIEKSQKVFSDTINEQLKSADESNKNQLGSIRKELSEQYTLLKNNIEGNNTAFKTKLDEINKDVYDMKSRTGQVSSATTVVSQPVSPNAMVPTQQRDMELERALTKEVPLQPTMPQPVKMTTDLLTLDKRQSVIKEILVGKYLVDMPSGTSTKSMVELVNDNNLINQLWSKTPDVDKNRLMSTELRELSNISEKYNLALKNKINSNSGLDNIYNKINADLNSRK